MSSTPLQKETPCIEPGCHRFAKSRYYCVFHYQQERFDQEWQDIRRANATMGCREEGCEHGHYAKGMCRNHYENWRRYMAGETKKPRTIRVA